MSMINLLIMRRYQNFVSDFGQKLGSNFDELPCITHKLAFVFCCFSTFISLGSVGTKEMTILHIFPAFLTISQRKSITKCVKAAICITSFIQIKPTLIPCFWSIFAGFQNNGLNANRVFQPN